MDEVFAASEVDVAAGEAAVLIAVLIDEGRTSRANVTFDAACSGALTRRAKNAA